MTKRGPKELTPFRRHMLPLYLKKRDAMRVVRRLCAAPRPVAFKTSWGAAVVHGDTRRPGQWRVTWLDKDGTPWGHIEPKSYRDCLLEAREHSADLTEEIVSVAA